MSESALMSVISVAFMSIASFAVGDAKIDEGFPCIAALVASSLGGPKTSFVPDSSPPAACERVTPAKDWSPAPCDGYTFRMVLYTHR